MYIHMFYIKCFKPNRKQGIILSLRQVFTLILLAKHKTLVCSCILINDLDKIKLKYHSKYKAIMAIWQLSEKMSQMFQGFVVNPTLPD